MFQPRTSLANFEYRLSFVSAFILLRISFSFSYKNEGTYHYCAPDIRHGDPVVSSKQRIDNLLVENGFAESSAAAKAMVMAGIVLIDDKRVEKSSEMFPPDAAIRIKDDSPASKYVGRGGLKLEKALDEFHIRPDAYICLDVGSSTGGFTDCLLQNGALRVVAVDAGTNQLDWKLRNDPRVDVRENTNARDISADDLDEQFDLIVMDVSFISVRMILPAIVPLMKPAGAMLSLIHI